MNVNLSPKPINEGAILRSIYERVDSYLLASGRNNPRFAIITDPNQQAFSYAWEVGLSRFEKMILRRAIEGEKGELLAMPDTSGRIIVIDGQAKQFYP